LVRLVPVPLDLAVQFQDGGLGPVLVAPGALGPLVQVILVRFGSGPVVLLRRNPGLLPAMSGLIVLPLFNQQERGRDHDNRCQGKQGTQGQVSPALAGALQSFDPIACPGCQHPSPLSMNRETCCWRYCGQTGKARPQKSVLSSWGFA